MKSLVFAGVMAGVAALACAAPASASVFDLSFSGAGISGELVSFAGQWDIAFQSQRGERNAGRRGHGL